MTINTFRAKMQAITDHAAMMMAVVEAMNKERAGSSKAELEALEQLSATVAEYSEEVSKLSDMISRMLEYSQPATRKQFDELMAQFGRVHAALHKVDRDVMPRQEGQESLVDTDYKHLLDMEAIASCADPSEKITLEGAIEKTQMDVVELASDPNYLGALSDQKLKARFKPDENKTVEGVFVKEHRLFAFDPHGVVEHILQSAVKKNPDDQVLKDFVAAIQSSPYESSALLLCAMTKEQQKNVLEAQRTKEENGEKFDKIRFLGSFNATRLEQLGILKGRGNLQWDTLKNNKHVTELLKTVRGTLTEDEIRRMDREFVEYGGNGIQRSEAQIGSSRVGRNYAISKIAMLLNASEVVSRTEPMKAEYAGQHFSGYFMQDVKGQRFGEEYIKGMRNAGYGNMTADSFGVEAKKQLAKLQIIDYLCQNKQRSPSNIRVQMDENFRVKGIVGVDNELTFPEHGITDVLHHLNPVSLDSIIAIPEETAQIIRDLDPNVLYGALADTGLTEKEREGAARRLKSLQDQLKNVHEHQQEKGDPMSGVIRIYSDEDWRKMSMDTLGTEEFVDGNLQIKNKSIFKKVNDIRHKIADRQAQLGPQALKHATADNPVLEGKKVDLFSDESMKAHQRMLKGYLDTFTSTEHWYQWGSHEQFEAMKTGLEQLMRRVPTDHMTVDACSNYLKDIPKLEARVKAYITYKAPRNDSGEVAATRLKEAKALAEYLKNFRENLYKAYDNKTSAEADGKYKNTLRKQKVDRIANAIVRGAQAGKMPADADPKAMKEVVQHTEKAEAAVRNTGIFKTMISDREYNKTGKSCLNHFAEQAENNPEGLQKTFKDVLEHNINKVDKSESMKLQDAKAALAEKVLG